MNGPGADTTPPCPSTESVTAPTSRWLRDAPPARAHLWNRLPLVPLLLALALGAFTIVSPVADNPRLVWSFLGVGGAAFLFGVIVWVAGRRRGLMFETEFVPVASHYVQACVQLGILLYWGLFWERVYPEMPLMLGQLMYVYILDALLSWVRGRTWRIGFGPFPIVISTNLLLWFQHDWYFLQFAMLTVGVVAKQFLQWNRDGRRTHIFNPSAFGQFVFAVGLIATGTTKDLTWGREIATTFEAPHMLVVIFAAGLIVQSLFHVTLMTMAAVTTLCAIDLVYTRITGVYAFVNVSVAAPIFLGMHLLITDPATSPRTNVGRVIFGMLYACGYAILFRVLDLVGVPLFWDKLLPVPILNLCVPLIDRASRWGAVGRLDRAWETALSPGRMNLVHMGCWIAIFGVMWGSGYIGTPHPGDSIPFWKHAYVEGKPHAGSSLLIVAGGQATVGHSGAAYNELGLICMEGTIVEQKRGRAASYFEQACELGNIHGCANVVMQYLFYNERLSDEAVVNALERLEQDCEADGDWGSCFLIGLAYERGRGRPRDWDRAVALYQRCGLDNIFAAKGLARIAITRGGTPDDFARLVPALRRAADHDDAESCWYLAHMMLLIDREHGMARGAQTMLERACALGMVEACEALKSGHAPTYREPAMLVPTWSSAYPVQPAPAESTPVR